jgi:uncharacterized protein
MSPTYSIPFSGLKEGRHIFDFEIDNRFFEKFEESEVKEGGLKADVTLDKRSTHLDMMIRITGSVRICCDRCLEMFSHPVGCENRLLIKFGTNEDESDPDILYLSYGENELDLSQHLYEFIMLALPIRRIHPDDSQGNSTCDPAMIQKLEELRVDEAEGSDPRWDELKKLMNNN